MGAPLAGLVWSASFPWTNGDTTMLAYALLSLGALLLYSSFKGT
jgi:hypothetical protein